MLRTRRGTIRRTSTATLLIGLVAVGTSCASSAKTSASTTTFAPSAVFVTIPLTAANAAGSTATGDVPSSDPVAAGTGDAVGSVTAGVPNSATATSPGRSTSKPTTTTTTIPTASGPTTTAFTLKSIPISDVTYTVVPNDFLVKIATTYCTNATSIAYANGWADGKSHKIYPGDVIHLPAKICAPGTTTTTATTVARATTTTKSTTPKTSAPTTAA